MIAQARDTALEDVRVEGPGGSHHCDARSSFKVTMVASQVGSPQADHKACDLSIPPDLGPAAPE
jgi:hypothetical protein